MAGFGQSGLLVRGQRFRPGEVQLRLHVLHILKQIVHAALKTVASLCMFGRLRLKLADRVLSFGQLGACLAVPTSRCVPESDSLVKPTLHLHQVSLELGNAELADVEIGLGFEHLVYHGLVLSREGGVLVAKVRKPVREPFQGSIRLFLQELRAASRFDHRALMPLALAVNNAEAGGIVRLHFFDPLAELGGGKDEDVGQTGGRRSSHVAGVVVAAGSEARPL